MSRNIGFLLIFIISVVCSSCSDTTSTNDESLYIVEGNVFFDYQLNYESTSERYFPPSIIKFNSKETDSHSFNGAFNFSENKNGSYNLEVNAEGFEGLNEEVLINDSDINLQLKLVPLYNTMFSFSINNEWSYSYYELSKSESYPRIERVGEMRIEIVATEDFVDGTYYELKETLTYTNIAYSGFSDDSKKDTTYYDSEGTFFAFIDSNEIVHFDAKNTRFSGILSSIAIHDFNNKIPSYFIIEENFNITRFFSTMKLKTNTGIVSFIESKPQDQYFFELKLIGFVAQ